MVLLRITGFLLKGTMSELLSMENITQLMSQEHKLGYKLWRIYCT